MEEKKVGNARKRGCVVILHTRNVKGLEREKRKLKILSFLGFFLKFSFI